MDPNRSDHDDLVEPPPSFQTIAVIALIGTALCGFAALLGQVDTSSDSPIVGIRVIATIAGMIVTGAAMTLNGTCYGAWFLGALTCLTASVGFPESWDSFRLVARVFDGVCAIGGVLLLAPAYPRMLCIAFGVILHFALIMSAVTAPSPSPWISQQVWARYARPYLYFAYLNNAYQFYSPDPGPASELWFLVEYEIEGNDAVAGVTGAIGQTEYYRRLSKKWYKLPKRPSQVKDPFAQSYYRRLSLSEYASHTQLTPLPAYLRKDLEARRMGPVGGAIAYGHASIAQYAEPNDEVKRSIIPSYIRHVADEHAQPRPEVKATIKGIRLYRVQHRIISMEQFVGTVPDEYVPFDDYGNPTGGKSMFDPSTYLPYYMGEYDTQGRIMDRSDPLVYWLVPILPQYKGHAPPAYASIRKLSPEDYAKYYHDFVNQQTGSDHRQGD